MSKLDPIKAKIAALQAQIAEKTDKIGFIRAWKEKRAQAAAAGPKPPDPLALSSIYRDGSTGTRFQVLAFYLFVVVALVSAGSLAKKVLVKMRSSKANQEMAHDISHGMAEIKQKKLEQAEMLSLGQFTANIYQGTQEEGRMMSIDLWLRVSDPNVAAEINNRNDVYREKTMDALNELFVGKVNMLQEDGKAQARDRIRDSINSALKSGKVEDVFIQNLVVQ